MSPTRYRETTNSRTAVFCRPVGGRTNQQAARHTIKTVVTQVPRYLIASGFPPHGKPLVLSRKLLRTCLSRPNKSGHPADLTAGNHGHTPLPAVARYRLSITLTALPGGRGSSPAFTNSGSTVIPTKSASSLFIRAVCCSERGDVTSTTNLIVSDPLSSRSRMI
jgi:hypothetical protein